MKIFNGIKETDKTKLTKKSTSSASLNAGFFGLVCAVATGDLVTNGLGATVGIVVGVSEK